MKYTDLARVSSASEYSTSPDDIILLALDPNGNRLETPYFWDWLINKYETKGYSVDQVTKDLLTKSHKLSPVTNTNVSFILDQNAPEGTNPYVVEVNVKDENGNMIMGEMPVTIKAGSQILDTGLVIDGYTNFTLSKYQESITAVVEGNEFFFGSQGSGSVKYDLAGMIRTQGAEGTDRMPNTKFTIIRIFHLHSFSFTFIFIYIHFHLHSFS